MGFFDIFRKSVKKTKQSLSLELDSFSGKITFDTLEELEEILILADVGVTTAGKICSRLGERIKRRNIDSTELRENLCEIVTELMEPDEPLVTETIAARSPPAFAAWRCRSRFLSGKTYWCWWLHRISGSCCTGRCWYKACTLCRAACPQCQPPGRSFPGRSRWSVRFP